MSWFSDFSSGYSRPTGTSLGGGRTTRGSFGGGSGFTGSNSGVSSNSIGAGGPSSINVSSLLGGVGNARRENAAVGLARGANVQSNLSLNLPKVTPVSFDRNLPNTKNNRAAALSTVATTAAELGAPGLQPLNAFDRISPVMRENSPTQAFTNPLSANLANFTALNTMAGNQSGVRSAANLNKKFAPLVSNLSSPAFSAGSNVLHQTLQGRPAFGGLASVAKDYVQAPLNAASSLIPGKSKAANKIRGGINSLSDFLGNTSTQLGAAASNVLPIHKAIPPSVSNWYSGAHGRARDQLAGENLGSDWRATQMPQGRTGLSPLTLPSVYPHLQDAVNSATASKYFSDRMPASRQGQTQSTNHSQAWTNEGNRLRDLQGKYANMNFDHLPDAQRRSVNSAIAGLGPRINEANSNAAAHARNAQAHGNNLSASQQAATRADNLFSRSGARARRNFVGDALRGSPNFRDSASNNFILSNQSSLPNNMGLISNALQLGRGSRDAARRQVNPTGTINQALSDGLRAVDTTARTNFDPGLAANRASAFINFLPGGRRLADALGNNPITRGLSNAFQGTVGQFTGLPSKIYDNLSGINPEAGWSPNRGVRGVAERAIPGGDPYRGYSPTNAQTQASDASGNFLRRGNRTDELGTFNRTANLLQRFPNMTPEQAKTYALLSPDQFTNQVVNDPNFRRSITEGSNIRPELSPRSGGAHFGPGRTGFESPTFVTPAPGGQVRVTREANPAERRQNMANWQKAYSDAYVKGVGGMRGNKAAATSYANRVTGDPNRIGPHAPTPEASRTHTFTANPNRLSWGDMYGGPSPQKTYNPTIRPRETLSRIDPTLALENKGYLDRSQGSDPMLGGLARRGAFDPRDWRDDISNPNLPQAGYQPRDPRIKEEYNKARRGADGIYGTPDDYSRADAEAIARHQVSGRKLTHRPDRIPLSVPQGAGPLIRNRQPLRTPPSSIYANTSGPGGSDPHAYDSFRQQLRDGSLRPPTRSVDIPIARNTESQQDVRSPMPGGFAPQQPAFAQMQPRGYASNTPEPETFTVPRARTSPRGLMGSLGDAGKAFGGLVASPFKLGAKLANNTVMPMASDIATSAAQPFARRAVDRAAPGGRMQMESPIGTHRISNLKVRPEVEFGFGGRSGLRPEAQTTLNISLNDEITPRRIGANDVRHPGTPGYVAPKRPAARPTQTPPWQPPPGTPPWQPPPGFSSNGVAIQPNPQDFASSYTTPLNAPDRSSIRRAQQRGDIPKVNLGPAPELNRNMTPPRMRTADFHKPIPSSIPTSAFEQQLRSRHSRPGSGGEASRAKTPQPSHRGQAFRDAGPWSMNTSGQAVPSRVLMPDGKTRIPNPTQKTSQNRPAMSRSLFGGKKPPPVLPAGALAYK